MSWTNIINISYTENKDGRHFIYYSEDIHHEYRTNKSTFTAIRSCYGVVSVGVLRATRYENNTRLLER